MPAATVGFGYERKNPVVDTLKAYYWLTKPGIIRGNLLAATAGFLLASRGNIQWGLLAAALTGTSLIIACGCVLNNYIDRGIDKKMQRTKKRALVTGRVSVRSAISYAIVLGLAGLLVLAIGTNWLTVTIGLTGLFFYVVLYGIWKRRSPLGTVIGSVSGATPPVAGYCAVTGGLDMAAVLLFLILVFWQMPHFYAIALQRLDEYTAAGLPVLPAVRGARITKLYILAYSAAFVIAAVMLALFGHVGYWYLAVIILLSLVWLGLDWRGFSAPDDQVWARGVFHYSLVVLTLFSFMISVDALLPW